jgi:hypothetical protein
MEKHATERHFSMNLYVSTVFLGLEGIAIRFSPRTLPD